MAIGPASSTVIGKLTKKMYQDGLPDEFITEAPYVKGRRKKPLPLGTDVTRAYAASWQEGLGNVTDTDDLPTPDAPTFRNPTFDAVDISNVLQLTDKEIDRTKNSMVAMAQYLKTVLTGSAKNFWRDMDYRCLADQTAKRAVTSGVSAQGSDVTVTCTAGTTPLRGIRVNMKLAFYNETTGQIYERGVRVTSVNITAGTFVVATLQTDIPSAAGVYLDAAAERNNDINGLVNLVNDSTGPATVLGLSSSLSDWQSLVLGNSGTARPVTLELLDQAYYNSLEQAGEKASEDWMNYTQVRKLVALANRQIIDKREGNTLKVNTHNEVEFIGSAKVMADDQAPSGKIYNIVAEDFAVDETKSYAPLSIDGDDGAVWDRIPGRRVFEAAWIWTGNHTLKSRRIHTVITDLATS